MDKAMSVRLRYRPLKQADYTYRPTEGSMDRPANKGLMSQRQRAASSSEFLCNLLGTKGLREAAQDFQPPSFQAQGGSMSRTVISLVVASLACIAGPPSAMTAAPAPDPVADVDILVEGAPQRRYLHGGRWYVEALKGREYAIRLRNPYGVRVAIALSVDGLNTIDARRTTAAEARKWVLGPYETVTIRGWQTSRTEARRFEFTTEARSYAEALGQTGNLGVISAVFFRERVRAMAWSEADSSASEAPHAPAPGADLPAAQERARSGSNTSTQADAEFAATGMGRRTNHAVTQVRLDLEEMPAQTVNIRYEFQAQLVKLGIFRSTPKPDPLTRREGALGFEPGFAPELPHHR
jgi:hypothetical protein